MSNDTLIEKLLRTASLQLEINGYLTLDTQAAMDAAGILIEGTDPDLYLDEEN